MNKIFKEEEFADAYAELLEILKYIPEEDYKKIDKDELEYFEEKSNKNLSFKYNPDIDLNEQNVSTLTKYLIIILYKKYWATEEQRSKMMESQKIQEEKNEKQKREKYNPDVFGSKLNIVQEAAEEIDTKNLEMIKYKKSKIRTIMDKVFSIFKKNKK